MRSPCGDMLFPPVQIFSPVLLPPHHFETVVYGGAIRWAVLIGLDLAIVPIGASDDKKVVRFKIREITSLTISRTEHFAFADAESTQRTAKVVVVVEESVIGKNSPASSGGNSPLSPLARIKSFGTSLRKTSQDTAGSGSDQIASKKRREESFYIGVDVNSKMYECIHSTWMCMLTSQAYGWTRVDDKQKSKDKIKALYLDLCEEIAAASGLQDRVDLFDELALASRFNFHLKRLVLFQPPPMLQTFIAELRKLTLEKWRLNPDLAHLGRAEALQYMTVMLEALHKTLFLAWPLFSTPEGRAQLHALLDPKAGLIVQLIGAVLGNLVAPEELRFVS